MKLGKAARFYDANLNVTDEHYYDADGNEITREEYSRELDRIRDLVWESQLYVDRVLSRGY